MNRFIFIYGFFALSLCAFLIGYAFYSPAEVDWYNEGSFVEQGAAMMFGMSGVIALGTWANNRKEIYGLFSLLMIMASFREFDGHKEFTTMSILKSRFYVSENVPMIEKIIGGIFILVLLYAALRLSTYLWRWVKNVFKFQMEAWIIGIGLGSMVIAKALDTLPRNFPELLEYGYFMRAIEESLEFNSALFFVLVSLLIYKKN